MGGALEYLRRDGLTEFRLSLPGVEAPSAEAAAPSALDRV